MKLDELPSGLCPKTSKDWIFEMDRWTMDWKPLNGSKKSCKNSVVWSAMNLFFGHVWTMDQVSKGTSSVTIYLAGQKPKTLNTWEPINPKPKWSWLVAITKNWCLCVFFLHSDPPHPCSGVCCCFTFPWDDSPQVDSHLFQIPSPDQKVNSKPAILQCSTYSWIFTAKNPRISPLPIDISLQISPVPAPRLFSKLRKRIVGRQCRACATKIPWIPECIRRRAACSKLVRAMGGRYGEGSRRRPRWPGRPGWRSPSISSKASGANGRGEGTWQGKVLGCRCKFNGYLALYIIRYYIYIYIQLYIYIIYMMMYYLVPSAAWDPNSRPYACWNRSLDFNDIVVIPKRCHVLCNPLGWDGSKQSTRIHHRQAARELNLWLPPKKNAKKNLIHKPIQLTISSNLIHFTKSSCLL